MTGIFIAIISGILMSLQGVFNTGATKQTSLWITTTLVNLTGLVVCLAFWFFTDRTHFGKLLTVRPYYLLLGGVIGAFITYTVIVSMQKMGPALAVMFIVIAQLISAYAIELLGWFGCDRQPLDKRKVLGMIVALLGVIIFKWK